MNAFTKPSGTYNVIDHTYDVIVVGAGGAGLRATLGMGASGLERPRLAGLGLKSRRAWAETSILPLFGGRGEREIMTAFPKGFDDLAAHDATATRNANRRVRPLRSDRAGGFREENY